MTGRTDKALKLWVVLNRAVRSIETHLREQVERHGLSFTEFAVLEVLLHKGPLPIGDIGERVLRTSGSMTYVINKLEKRNLLHRMACASDRRITYAELTKAGKSLIRNVFAEHEALLTELTGGLDDEELVEATGLLKRLGLYASRSIEEPV
jgi:MarR family 2-MHQ and catechol resistance regulon transcriptional repressor